MTRHLPALTKRSLLLLLAGTALVAGLFFGLLRPAQSSAAQWAAESDTTASELTAAKSRQAALTRGGRGYLDKLYATARTAEQVLPDTPGAVEEDLPRLVAAQQLSLTDLSREDDVPAAGTKPAYTPFKMTLTGDLAHLRNFIQVVENYPRLLSLSMLSLTAAPPAGSSTSSASTGAGAATLSVTLKVWHSPQPVLGNPKDRPVRALPPVTGATGSTGSTGTSGRSTGPSAPATGLTEPQATAAVKSAAAILP